MGNLIWRTIKVNIQLNISRPWGFVAIAVLILWAVSIPSIGINKADFLARTQELGYPPLSSAQRAGLGAGQVASSFMSLFGTVLFLDNLDRERAVGLDELFASLPFPGSLLVGMQYLANVVTLLAFAVVAYAVVLIAYPFRGFDTFSIVEFVWPSLLFPFGSALLLASLPLFLDALRIRQIARGIVYGLVLVMFNLGPFALAAMTNLNHPRHPLFQVWFTANLGLDTFGIWYLQGYLDLVLEIIEQLGTPVIPSELYWAMVLRPRLVSVLLGLVLAAFAAWRFRRFAVE
jgi:hypothetical protein